MMTPFEVNLPVRSDSQGDGKFGAPRGGRVHLGIDYACYPGTEIISPVDGKVRKIGFAYGDGTGGFGDEFAYRIVEVEQADDPEIVHRFFYCTALKNVGDEVFAGEVIAKSQDLTIRYPGMTNHVHYEVRVRNEPVDPEKFWSY